MATSPPASPQWRLCWSPWNYTSFITWFGNYASADEQREVLGLYMVVHRQKPSELLQARGIVPQELEPSLRLRDGSVHQLPSLPCQDVGCKRCDEGRGGWQWRWCDKRWTPSAALDLALTPQELQTEMYRPWPRGLLPSKPVPRGDGTDQGTSAASAGPQAGCSAAKGKKNKRRSNRGQATTTPSGAPPGTLPSGSASSSSSGAPPQAWMVMAIPEPAFMPAAPQEAESASGSDVAGASYQAGPTPGL